MTMIPDRAGRLWQIAYVVGGVPTATDLIEHDPFIQRIMSTAFRMGGSALSAWLDQAAEEYGDANPLFESITDSAPIDMLVNSATAFFDVPATAPDLRRAPDRPMPPSDPVAERMAGDRIATPRTDAAPVESVHAS